MRPRNNPLHTPVSCQPPRVCRLGKPGGHGVRRVRGLAPRSWLFAALGALLLAGAAVAFLIHPAQAQGEAEPLTGSFLADIGPTNHGGEGKIFTIPIRFSEDSDASYRVLRDRALEVEGGAAREFRRVDGSNSLWEIHVAPDSDADVTLRLPETTDCSVADAVCTAAAKPLSQSVSIAISAPVPERPLPPEPTPEAPATAERTAAARPCEDGYDAPTPAEVAVTEVPVVVESTTADYFVLYASHDGDGSSTVEYPVRVVRGQEGTTTLSENVAALPAERYRVERYLVADPADVDGDCIDELGDLGTLNPVNPTAAMDLSHGAVAIPDWETFETLAYDPGNQLVVKYIIVDVDTDRPNIYFINTNTFKTHAPFVDLVGINRSGSLQGTIVYDPNLIAPNGSSGVYRYRFDISLESLGDLDRHYALFAASMPVLDDNLAHWIWNTQLASIQAALPQYRVSRMNLVFDEDVYGETSFLALNQGEGYGLLREMDPDERPNPRDVVIYGTLPNELPRVAGIISGVPQTPLSHVNLRAVQDGAPNAFIRGALEDDAIGALIGSHVYYVVTEAGYSIRAATRAEVAAHFAASRPAGAQTPERDLSVTSITPLDEVGFDDWDAFGVKAANVAVLGSLGFPEGTVPEGYAAHFYFYDEFMKHNGLYDDVAEILADPEFQTDYQVQADELKKLRKKIKKGETPEWIETALKEMHAGFPEDTSLRYRSSTNNEDLPGFSGAGLYDSKTQHPEETEEDGISKSLKQVYASLWNFRAFIERDFHRIDHLSAAMGVLVHPNYSDELVNGVAVSVDPAYGTEGTHYVNSQVGEDLVTNPEAHSAPEEVLLNPDGTYTVVALSNQAPPGQLLMTGGQLRQLRQRLAAIHGKFAELYGVAEGERFAMEVEFKITSDNVLAIKQARPWIFTDPLHGIDDTQTGNSGVALTGWFVPSSPATHNGKPFRVYVRFSENLPKLGEGSRNSAFTVTGGSASGAQRVDAFEFRREYWAVEVTPDSPLSNVTLVMVPNRPCTVPSAVCSYSRKRLSNRLEHTVEGLLPRVPDRPTGRVLATDSVELEWNDAPRADAYEVQFLHDGRWTDLPANGTEIAFDGSHAVVTGLPVNGVYYFRVRASNSHGVSEWSDQLFMPVKTVWESELTPGRDTHVFPVASGYSVWGSVGGVLSPDGWSMDGATYGVQYLVHASESLWLGLDRQLPMDFALLVGDSVYYGRESAVSASGSGPRGYWWPAGAPDWSGDDPVRVSLMVLPDVPLESRPKAPVTGYFQGFPAEHERNRSGNEEVSFRIYFSEGVAATAEAMGAHVLSVSGGTVSGVRAVDGEGRIWAVSVTPGSENPVRVVIELSLDCALPGSVCTADGRRLFNRMELTVKARAYHPPSGLPTISGTVEVGETLTADTSGIADADGLDNATFRHQWLRNDGNGDTDMEGETGATYTLTAEDEGQAFRVRVSFTDDAGYEEALTSALAYWKRPYALAAEVSDRGVVLTWKQPVGSPYSYVFRVLRHRPELGEAEPLVHVRYSEDAMTAYTDTDVEPGVLYVYRVKGADFVGRLSEASEPVEIRTPESTPPNFKVAFIGDQGLSDASRAVLQLIKDEGADMVLHQGDFDYVDSPYAWDQQINQILGEDFPYFASIGNHDVSAWGGYQRKLQLRLARISGAHCTGDLGVNSFCTYRGLFFVLSGVGTLGSGHVSFITEALASQEAQEALWRICSWHKNQRLMQVGGKGNSVGWEPYEECRKGGAIIATGHEHSYSRTHLMDSFETQSIASTSTVHITRGNSFAFVSGLGGVGIRGQDDELAAKPWWAAVHTSAQGADFGALFCAFNHKAVENRGHCYFKDLNGVIADEFEVIVAAASETPGPAIVGRAQVGETLTADTSGIADEDGLTNTVYNYQWLADGAEVEGAISPTYTLSDSDEGKSIQVEVSFTDDAGNEEALTSAATSAVVAAPVSLTASFQDAPESHDGENAFTFELRFSEEFELSYVTLRDHAFTVTGGEVTGARRLVSGSNIRWEITVRPDGDGEVTAVLPATNDCDDEGAICTGDGRMLSTEVKLTVAGPAEEKAKAATPNNPATGDPTVTSAPQVGETLTANTSDIADQDGLDNATFSYQWIRVETDSTEADISGATGSTYTLVEDDKGKSIQVEVSFTDDGGNEESLTSAATSAVVAAPVSLTASFQDAPESHDGENAFTFELRFSEEFELSYVTLRDHAFTVTGGEVTGALRLVSGSNIRWEITVRPDGDGEVTAVLPRATDCDAQGAVCTGDGRMLSNKVQLIVAGPGQLVGEGEQTPETENSPATGVPAIDGTAQVGQALSVDVSGIADADGLGNATFSYQWVSSDGTTDADIQDATGSTYTLVSADEGKTVKVRVSFTDDAGNPESLSSAPTAVVAPKPNSPATGAPSVSGTAEVGETITAETSGIADADGLGNATFSYQWVSSDGSTDADIQDATDSTYTLVSADEGKTVKVRVSFTDAVGNPESLTSAPTDAIAPVPISEEETEDDSPIWSATLKAGLVSYGYGYSASTGAGELSPTSFDLDGVTYTVNLIEAWGWMYIGMDKELPMDFTLEVDGKQYDSSDASLTSYSYANIYKWEEAQLEWAEGDTIELALYPAD